MFRELRICDALEDRGFATLTAPLASASFPSSWPCKVRNGSDKNVFKFCTAEVYGILERARRNGLHDRNEWGPHRQNKRDSKLMMRASLPPRDP